MSVEVFHSLAEARGHFGPCALAIGNFDGVHIGHRYLIGKAVACARAKGVIPAVLTFYPHPTAIVAPERVPLLICSLAERLRLLARAGAERIFVLNFTAEVARLTPQEFVTQILMDGLETKAVFVGENFRFGHRQEGTTERLRDFGDRFGFSSCFVEPVRFRGSVVSSTAIRQELSAGRVTPAARLLGRCYSLAGEVVSGRGIGSKQTVPTLNLRPSPELLVPRGIYVTETMDAENGRRWNSVTSAGYNPTFGATDLTAETYLLSKLEGASPPSIAVAFRRFLRWEEKYPDAATLKAQILKDVVRSEAYWRRAAKWAKPSPSIY